MGAVENAYSILEELSYYLRKKDYSTAIKFVSQRARAQHIARFKEQVQYIEKYPPFVRFVGEYILVCRKPFEGYWRCAVLGIDDEGYIFVHRMDGNQADIVFRSPLSSKDIREKMGFTHHWFEVGTNCEAGWGIRIQGDIVLWVDKVFRDSYEALLNALFLLIESIVSEDYKVSYSLGEPPRALYIYGPEYVPKYFRDLIPPTIIKAVTTSQNQTLRFLSRITKMSKEELIEVGKRNMDKLEEFFLGIWDYFIKSEKKLKFEIGDHTIEVIGLHNRTLNTTMILGDTNKFLTIRNSKLRATHPEHNIREFPIYPGIYRIESLISEDAPEIRRLTLVDIPIRQNAPQNNENRRQLLRELLEALQNRKTKR